jgi:hypothetical protein
VGQVDKVPADEGPAAIRPWFVLEAGEEVDGVVAHFVRRDLRLEIECAGAAVPAADGVAFGTK